MPAIFWSAYVWWDKSNVKWFLRGQTSDKICQYKKSRSSIFILGKRKWRTFSLEDANGKLLVKVLNVTLFESSSDRLLRPQMSVQKVIMT